MNRNEEKNHDRELFAKAVAFAAIKHGTQERRNGTAYIYHPLKVAEIVRNAGYDIRYQIAAVLHDVLEDTDATEDEVREFGEDIFEAVKLVTRPKGMDEAEYVAAILKNRMASVVKNADKMHNIWECSNQHRPGDKLTPEELEFAEKYIKKARTYYEGKFTKALDVTINVADASVHGSLKGGFDILWYGPYDMELYVIREV